MNTQLKGIFETKIRENPFQHFYPDQQLRPQNIVDLFVKEYTEYNALVSHTHTFVYGSRGSGKTMLLKSLEPACQSIQHGGLTKFFDQAGSFIGIFLSYNTGDFTKVEFCKLLQDDRVPDEVSKKILMHYFVMDIAESTLETVLGQLSERVASDEEKARVPKIVKELARDTTAGPRTLKELQQTFHAEKQDVLQAIREYQQNYGVPDNRLIYRGALADTSCQKGTFLYVFFSEIRHLIGAPEIPFFLLLDEVTEVEGVEPVIRFHEEVINTFVSQRVQDLLCVKVSACHESYSVDTDINGREIQEIHDYYVVNLDSLYTNNRENYYRRIERIVNKRLNIAQWQVEDIRGFLPENPAEAEKMRKAIELTGQEYEELSEEKKIESKQNYINKYARARFFQKFLEKTEYGYTGFDNLVHFSSGITRTFLDACFHMVNEYTQKHPETHPGGIPSIPFEIQKNAIETYSNRFVDKGILEPMKRRPLGSPQRELLERLFHLINSLGKAFKIRLENESSRYPRIISFSIKETVRRDPKLEAVLQKALRECFFHRKWYRGKSGYEMLECFILNKRLCPRYKLDLSGFQGRVEFSQKDLLLAIERSDEFIKWFKKREKTAGIEDEQLPLFDM